MRLAALASVLGGVAWLGLIAASELYERDDLSYGGYYRYLALPLLLFVIAWIAFRGSWPQRDLREQAGYFVTLAGLALVFAGAALEFWGSWAVGEPIPDSGYGAEDEVWRGAELGRTVFLLGFLLLLVGGVTAGVAACRARFVPTWAAVLIGLAGFGILLGNMLQESSLPVTAVGFGLFGLGWIALGVSRLRGGYSPSGTTTS